MTDPPYRNSDAPPRCPCGHHRDHYMVSAIPSYTALGWFLFLFGISAPMSRMTFKCRVCDQVIEETTDPALMERNRLRG